jgi:membrane protease YdiL (CAAX protease family)
MAVWLVAARAGLMPSLRQSLASGGSWRRVVNTGLIAAAILLVLEVAIAAAAGGTFGFHPYFPKMAGDLVSNMYEELVYRGVMFCAFYGVAAGASFAPAGKLDRAGMAFGTLGSCLVFAIGHEQYPVELRVLVGVVAVVFAYPWIAARSLWAPWIAHMLGDVVGDTFIEL